MLTNDLISTSFTTLWADESGESAELLRANQWGAGALWHRSYIRCTGKDYRGFCKHLALPM